MVEALVTNWCTADAWTLVKELRASEDTRALFNTVLNAFAQGGAMDRVPALLADMKNATPPAEPDIVTYSTIVKGYCNSGGLDRALEIVKDMQSDGKLSPDEVM